MVLRALPVAVPVVLAAVGSASAETLTLTSVNPPTQWSDAHGIVPFMDCVKEASGAEIDFNFFHSGQLTTAANSLDALNNGLADISYVVPTALSNKLPIFNVGLLPGMGETVTETTAAMRTVLASGGPFADELEANGIKPVLVNMFPPYQVNWRDEAVTDLAGFESKKVRVAGGAQSAAISMLGAAPVQVPLGDIYLAMMQGTVDGYAFSPVSINDVGLTEVTKAISANGNFGGAAGLLSLSDAAYERLSPEHRELIMDCGLKLEAELAAYVDGLTAEVLEGFKAQGIDVYEFSEEAKAAIGERLEEGSANYVERLNEAGLPGDEALGEYVAALTSRN